jgi:hypothetical protein
MGATFNTGYLENLILYNGSNNIGIGTSADATYKVTLGGSLLGTSATFSSTVLSNSSLKVNAKDGFLLRTDSDSSNVGGFSRLSYLTGTAADPVIFSTSGYGLYFYVDGSTTKGLTLSNTGAATFSSSVTAGNATPPISARLNSVATSGGYALALSDNVNCSLYVNMLSGGAIIGTDAGNALRFATGGSTATQERMRITSGGSVGIGTTPPTNNGGTSVWIGGTGGINDDGASYYVGMHNAYYNSGWKYLKSSVNAQYYLQDDVGNHIWASAASGTAGNAITFSEKMRITSGGNVQIDDSFSSARLAVRGGTGTYPSSNSATYTLSLNDPTSMAASVGGSILFQGYKTSNTAIGNFAFVVGKKQNGTAGDESGFLGFGTSDSAGTLSERMRITSGGDLYLGNTSFTSSNGADRFMGIYGGQDCSLILQDAVQTWELYVNDDFYITSGSTTRLSINRTTGAATFSSSVVSSDGYEGRYYKIKEASAARGGLYPYNLVTGTGTDYSIGIFSEGEMFFASGGSVTKRMIITSGGNVAITNNLAVGRAEENGVRLSVTSAGTTSAAYNIISRDSSGNDLFVVRNDGLWYTGTRSLSPYNYGVTAGVKALYVDSNGALGYNASIRESKTNINTINNVNWLMNLTPVTFNKKKKDSEGNYTEEIEPELHYGLIAEDVKEVNSDFVFYNTDGKLAGVHYDRLITPLLKAIQELKAEIDTLKN